MWIVLSVCLGMNHAMAQSNVTAPGDASGNFDYTQAGHPSGDFNYSENWKFTVADQGYVMFTVASSDEVDISFSDSNAASVDLFNVMIGDNANTSLLTATLQISADSSPMAAYTSPTPLLDPAAPKPYWITLNNGVVSLGAGSDITSAPLTSWDTSTSANAPSGVLYFTFSGFADAYFTKISSGSLPAGTPPPGSGAGQPPAGAVDTSTVSGRIPGKPYVTRHRGTIIVPTKSEALKMRRNRASLRKGPAVKPTRGHMPPKH